MKFSELKDKPESELEDLLHKMLREQFNLRMQNASGQLGDNSQLKKVRRNVARVKTAINQTRTSA